MQTFKPTTDIRIQAIQFNEWTTNFSNAYPMRIVIDDDASNKFHHEIWVARDGKWAVIMPGDWIVVDGDGFYSIDGPSFKAQYEVA